MTTALDIIHGAARIIGVIRKSEALTGDEASDALEALNDMIASWGNQTLTIYTRTRESFTLSAAASYTVGSGQTINTVTPNNIISAQIRIGTIDYDLEIIGDEEYETISLKSISSNIPQVLNYDNGHPYGTLKLWPLLSTSATLRILSEKNVVSFASLSDTVDLPGGWNRALKYNLALELASEYGKQVDPIIVGLAKESLGSMRLIASRNRPMPLESESLGRVKPSILGGVV